MSFETPATAPNPLVARVDRGHAGPSPAPHLATEPRADQAPARRRAVAQELSATLWSTADYRAVLHDAVGLRREHNPRYSDSALARELGIRRSHLSEVLKGKKGISGAIARRAADVIGLDGQDADAFCDLVDFEHARSRAVRIWARARLEARGLSADPVRPSGGSLQDRGELPQTIDLQGTWKVVARSRASNPLPAALQPPGWVQRWTFRGATFELESRRAGDHAAQLTGHYELRGNLLLLAVESVSEEGARPVDPGRRHYVYRTAEGDLLLKTPGVGLPQWLCARGEELESVLRRER
jgi:plasmid maintenance system antidote protein VapI